jgi:hypothetical protein
MAMGSGTVGGHHREALPARVVTVEGHAIPSSTIRTILVLLMPADAHSRAQRRAALPKGPVLLQGPDRARRGLPQDRFRDLERLGVRNYYLD